MPLGDGHRGWGTHTPAIFCLGRHVNGEDARGMPCGCQAAMDHFGLGARAAAARVKRERRWEKCDYQLWGDNGDLLGDCDRA